jgi:hypothetical protein
MYPEGGRFEQSPLPAEPPEVLPAVPPVSAPPTPLAPPVELPELPPELVPPDVVPPESAPASSFEPPPLLRSDSPPQANASAKQRAMGGRKRTPESECRGVLVSVSN